MSYAMGPYIGILCTGFFFLAVGGLGVFLLYRAYRSRQQAGASQGWPAVRGEVTEARLDQSTSTDRDGDMQYSYTPRLRYTYEVGGTVFTGEKITFGLQQAYRDEGKAQAVTQRFPVGSTVMVYYNPANPGEAVLEKSAGGFVISLILGIIFLLIASCSACAGLVISLTGIASFSS